jgi:hypothetical protein
MPKIASIDVEVPEQGFNQTYQLDEIAQFFEAEQKFINSIMPLLGEQLQWEGRSFATDKLIPSALRDLVDMRNLSEKGDRKKFDEYLGQARRLQVVVGQGVIGQRITELLAANRKDDAKWMFLMFSSRWSGRQVNDLLGPIRAAFIGHPMFMAFSDVAVAEQAVKVAKEAMRGSQQIAEEFEKFYEEKSALISGLEELFRKKLPVEEPAAFWGGIAASKTNQLYFWLFVFSAAAVGPIAAVVCYWGWISPELAKLTTAGNGLSLAGVAALTIPAVLYGWLLKNLSRILIQTMNVADDAAHRRALAITWLGLVAENRLGLTDEDRVLVLNAMFRPIPPYTQDEGPPAGLAEFIKARAH